MCVDLICLTWNTPLNQVEVMRPNGRRPIIEWKRWQSKTHTHTHTRIIIIVIIMSRHAASYCVNNISSLIFPAQTDSTCASLHYIETLESSLSTEQRWKPPDCCKDINRAKWVINHLIKHNNRGVPLTWQHFSLVPYLSMFLAYELNGKFPPKWIVIYSPPMPMKSDDEVL